MAMATSDDDEEHDGDGYAVTETKQIRQITMMIIPKAKAIRS